VPIAVIVPSWTAIAGVPGLAKMSMPRRVACDSIGLATFWPCLAWRLAARAEPSPA
jgi:hypothetical protein